MDFSGTLYTLLKHSTLNHHIPGRLRIKYSKKITSEVDLSDLKELKVTLSESRAIHDIRINAAGFTAIIQYDPNMISPEIWDRVFQNQSEQSILNVLNLVIPEAVS